METETPRIVDFVLDRPLERPCEELANHLNSMYNQLPVNAFLCNRDGIYLWCNKFQAKMARLESAESVFGKTIFDFIPEDVATQVWTDDCLVMEQNRTMTFHENGITQDGEFYKTAVTKTPVRNSQDEVVGMIGMAIVLLNRKPSEVEVISKLQDKGLTERESQCLFVLSKGKTAKEIAIRLDLSPRTVEKHIENIKNKLDCYRRSQLIEFVISAIQ